MIALTLAAAATVALCAGLLLLAPRKPGYSHLKHTISELGETGAPQQHLVSFWLFLPIGLLMLGVALQLGPDSGPIATLALCIAVGYGVAAFFPCDPGSPLSGSVRQVLHNLGGAVEYVGGGIALARIGDALGQPFKIAGFIVLGATVALSVLPSTQVRGAVQRVAEACLFVGLAGAIALGGARPPL